MLRKKNAVIIVSVNPRLSESLATWLKAEKLKPCRLGDIKLLNLMRTTDLGCVVIDLPSASIRQIADEAAKGPVVVVGEDMPLAQVKALHEAGVSRCLPLSDTARVIAAEVAKIIKQSPLRCQDHYHLKDLLQCARGRLLTGGVC